MLFDKLARIMEKNFSQEAIKFIEDSHLFVFPYKPHEVLPSSVDVNNFFLPFDTIAVEDAASCICIRDKIPGQLGMSCYRYFIELYDINPKDPTAFRDGTSFDLSPIVKRFGVGSSILSMGVLDTVVELSNGQYKSEGSLLGVYVIVDEVVVLQIGQDKISVNPKFDVILSNYLTALEEVSFFNSKEDHFVLENSPVPMKRGKLPIARSHQRPQYTILHPNEIRSQMKLPLPGDGTVAPHERRAHKHTFVDERFKKMKGKTIVYPSTWVGVSESVVGKRRYKVLLDIGVYSDPKDEGKDTGSKTISN